MGEMRKGKGLFEIEKKRNKNVFYLGDLKLIKFPPRTTRSGNIGQKIIIEDGPESTTIDVLYVFKRTRNEGKCIRVLRIQQGSKTIFLKINGLLLRLIEESITKDLPEYLNKLREKVMKNDRGA